MTDDNLISPGQPLESLRRILRKVAVDTVAEVRRKQFAEKWDEDKRKRAAPLVEEVERIADALSVEGEE